MTPRTILAGLLAVAAVAAAGVTLARWGEPDGARATTPVAAASPDEADGPTDGTVVATDDGLFFFLWDGGKQRIQQPAAFSESDLRDLGLTIGPPAPRRLTVGAELEDRLGTRFVMVPPDGPGARLHLLQDHVLHPLETVPVSADALAALPDLADLVVTRVRLP